MSTGANYEEEQKQYQPMGMEGAEEGVEVNPEMVQVTYLCGGKSIIGGNIL
jgi:hypothetical protein